MCAIWIKYVAWPDGDQEFLDGFANLILVEIVLAHVKFSKAKETGRALLQQSLQTNEQLGQMLQANMAEMQKLGKL
jgi:hypothetical protein